MTGFAPVASLPVASTVPPDPGLTLTADRGSFTLTGEPANVGLLISLAAANGSYTLSGQAASLSAGRKIIGAQGSYALSGQAATLKLSGKVPAAYGTYTLTGEPAFPRLDTTFGNLFTGMYTLTGQDAELESTTHWTDQDCTDSPWSHDECDCH